MNFMEFVSKDNNFDESERELFHPTLINPDTIRQDWIAFYRDNVYTANQDVIDETQQFREKQRRAERMRTERQSPKAPDAASTDQTRTSQVP